jgi:hypothetical protein
VAAVEHPRNEIPSFSFFALRKAVTCSGNYFAAVVFQVVKV